MFEQLEMTEIALWVGESVWGYPIMLSLHVVGLAILVGIFSMFYLRIMGAFSGIGLQAFLPLVKYAWVGFLINAVAGIALFTSQATTFVESLPFLIKIGLISLGVIFAAFIQSEVRKHSETNTHISVTVKSLAVLSMAVWIGAIISGRLIAYL
mgnify:CR=1 FL=1